MAYGRKTGGRRAGTPNRATSDARKALGALLDANAHQLDEWLNRVALGTKELKIAADGTKYEEYIVKPNPAKAFDMFQSLLEFHVPKLTRVQVGNCDAEPIVLETNLGVFGEILEHMKLHRQREFAKSS